MLLSVLRSRTALLCLALTASLCAFVGCNKSGDATGGSGGGSTASAGNGQAVFTANCTRCHSVDGSGRKDLSHIGSDPEHTAEWLAAFIKNPQSKKPNIRMPSFEGKISDSDLQALSTYLAGLK